MYSIKSKETCSKRYRYQCSVRETTIFLLVVHPMAFVTSISLPIRIHNQQHLIQIEPLSYNFPLHNHHRSFGNSVSKLNSGNFWSISRSSSWLSRTFSRHSPLFATQDGQVNTNSHDDYDGDDHDFHHILNEAYESEVAFLDELFWNVEISDDDAALFQNKNSTQPNTSFSPQVLSNSNSSESTNTFDSYLNYNDVNMVVTLSNVTGGVSKTPISDLYSISDLINNNVQPLDLLKLAPASQIAYFYLQSLGLSEETMWKITMEAGSILGLTVRNLRNKINFLQDSLGLTNTDIQMILTQQPTILQLSVERNLQPTIEFLEKELLMVKNTDDNMDSEISSNIDNAFFSNKYNVDFNRALRSIIMQYPCILCYSIQNLQKKIFFFRSTLGLSSNQTSTLLIENPQLLTLSVDKNLQPKLQFLRNEILLTISDLRCICLQNPRILLYSLRSNIFEKIISYFIMRLHMEVPKHTTKVLTTFPQILDYSLEHHLVPITLYFTETLGFSAIGFRTIFLKYPKIMTHSLEKIQHVIESLKKELDLSIDYKMTDESQLLSTEDEERYRQQVSNDSLKRILLQAPQIVGLDMEKNVLPKIQILKKDLGLDPYNETGEVRKLIVGMPTLLLCSVENNLGPKIQYLKSQFGTEMTKEIVLMQPALLGYSLENRIQPRLDRLTQQGHNPRKITSVLPLSQEKFEIWISKSHRSTECDSEKANEGRIINDYNDKYALVLSKSGIEQEDSLDMEKMKNLERERRKARVVHWNRRRPWERPAEN